MKYIISLYFFSVLFVSCTNRGLQESYIQAEGNRISLENVVKYYKEIDRNPEKLKAAEFLICNMQGHFSLNDIVLNDYSDSLSYCEISTSKDIIYRIWDNILKRNLDVETTRDEDLKTLSYDYIIDNIDTSYETWKNTPWYKQISFDIYCQYILPYRIKNEKLCELGWRDTLSSRYQELIKNETDVKKAFFIINDDIVKRFRNTQPNYPREMDALSIDKIRPGNCDLRCNLTVYVLRSLGIPASYDFVPYWSNYSTKGHSWVTLVTHCDSTFSLHKGDSIPKYNNRIDGSVFKADFLPEHDYPAQLDSIKRATNVFRYSFDIQEKIPNISYVKNVSAMYQLDKTLEVLNAPINKGNCSLSVFMTGQDWEVITEEPVINHKVSFQNIGADQLYLLDFEDENNCLIKSIPVIFHGDGNLEYLEVNKKLSEQIVIYRKYPLFIHQTETWCKMKGCVIEASQFPDFRKSEILLTVEKTPFIFSYHSVVPTKEYRYVRYRNTNRWATAIAEFEVYGNKKLNGTPIGAHSDSAVLARGVDGNYNTFVTSQGTDYWFGLDLGMKVEKIQKLRFLPKNDANFVEPGHDYEILYYDNQWVLLGGYKAKCDSLTCLIPTNSLILLRDLTTGKEERPFIFRNKRQIWW